MKSLFISFVVALYAIFIQVVCASPVVTWVEQGRDVILYCNLGGTEESFDWTRGPNYTASTQQLLAYNNGGVVRGACLTKGKCELLGKNLKVKTAQISDEDTYFCGTPKSYTSVQLNLTIQPSAPTINNCQSHTCFITFPDGFVLHLICVIRGSRPPAKLSWKINEKELTNMTNSSVHMNHDGTFDTVSLLHIKHNAPTVYKCEADGPSLQHSPRTTAEINVTLAVNKDSQDIRSKYPEIDYCRLKANCSISWPKGFPLELQCILKGAQNLMKVSWWHKQEELTANTTNEVHKGKIGYTIVSTVILHIAKSSLYYCKVPEASHVMGGTSTSTIYISSTESFPLESSKESHTDVWKILTLVCLPFLLICGFLLLFFIFRKRIKRFLQGENADKKDEIGDPLRMVESNATQESNENERKLLLETSSSTARDERDICLKETCPVRGFKAADKNTSSSSIGENSQHESSSSQVSSSKSEEVKTRVTTAATYPTREVLSFTPEKYSDGEETETDRSSSPITSQKGAVVPWSDEATVGTGEFFEEFSSLKDKGRLITANTILSEGRSCNFFLRDQESDIIIKFAMKGYGLFISFVPYLGPCDEGYIIHFREDGEITFSKYGNKIDLPGDENRFNPSKRLTFILNTACNKLLLMKVDDDKRKKPLVRFTPVQTELCEYLVISAHEKSEFEMVLLPVR